MRDRAFVIMDQYGHYNRYKKGVLYSSGGWEDQPNLYCEVMSLIESLDINQQNEEIKKRKSEMEKMKNGKP